MDEIKNESVTKPRRVIRVSRKKFAFLVLILLLVLGYWYLNEVRNRFYTGTATLSSMPAFDSVSGEYGGMVSPPSNSKMMYDEESLRYPYPYPGNQDPTIADTREFMKVSYSAHIKTRDVSETVKEVRNIVKGADGRIDDYQSSEKYGHVRFVVAKSDFDDMRDEIEAITHKKLYVETISTTNLLGEKQVIEGQTTAATNSLESLKSQLSALTTAHTKTVAALNSQITKTQADLTAVRALIINLATSSDAQVIASLRSQENVLVNDLAIQKQKLVVENNTYNSQKQNLDYAITYANQNLDAVNKKDVQFGNNIETVNGYVSVSWTSYWELAKIFSPVSPVIVIVVLGILVWMYLKRKGVVPMVEWL